MSFLTDIAEYNIELTDLLHSLPKKSIEIKDPQVMTLTPDDQSSSYKYSIETDSIDFREDSEWYALKGGILVEVTLPSGKTLLAQVNKDQNHLELILDVYQGETLTGLIIKPGTDLIFNEIKNRMRAWLTGEDAQRLQTLETNYQKLNDCIQANKSLTIPRPHSISVELIHKTVTSNFLSFIWGPPGTGKTKWSADLIQKLTKEGKTILVLSTSNQAVDNILLKYLELSAINHKSVRFGYPIAKNYHKLKESLPENYFKDLKLQAQMERIKDLKERIVNCNEDKRPELVTEIQAVRKGFKECIELLIGKSECNVFTTTTQAIINGIFKSKKFDYVLIDESSMMPEFILLNLINLAKSGIICVGDPKQLPPVIDETYPKLSRSPFYSLRNQYQPNCVFLNETWRVPQKIAALLSDLFYDNGLRSINTHEDCVEMVNLENLNTDRSGDGPSCLGSAKKICELILKHNLSNADVGIITPFRRQRRLIIETLKANNLSHLTHKVFTVHSSQGDQFEHLIFDTVHYGEATTPSPFVRSSRESFEVGDALLNVALSRVHKKLYLLYDEKFIEANQEKIYKLHFIVQQLG